MLGGSELSDNNLLGGHKHYSFYEESDQILEDIRVGKVCARLQLLTATIPILSHI